MVVVLTIAILTVVALLSLFWGVPWLGRQRRQLGDRSLRRTREREYANLRSLRTSRSD